MSIDTTEQANTRDADGDTSHAPSRRRRSSGSKPALSMLAQGEPMLWLTGGALAICLLMIIGLLAKVLISGMVTFWPVALVHVQLHDGSSYLGEITRVQEYPLSEALISDMPEGVATAARELLDQRESVPVRRRLMRTGNFELTNTHFHWISDFAIEPDGETTPPWALVIERLTWGRFYGEPSEFALRHPREVDEDEAELLEMLQFLQANQYRLSEEPDRTAFTEAVGELEQQYLERRGANVAAFLETARGDSEARIDAVVDPDRVAPLDEVSAEDNVTEFQEVWSTPEAAWDRFQQWHDAVRRRYREQRSLEKHEIGKINEREEHARLAVRRQEIDHDIYVLETARQMVQLQNEINALGEAQRQTTGTVQSLRRRFGGDSPLVAFGERFAAALGEENKQQASEPQERLATLDAELAEMPTAVQEAVREYVRVTLDCQDETLGVVEQIDELKAKNAEYELRLTTAQDQAKTLSLGEIVRAYPANQLTFADKLSIYLSRWREFLMDDPREANSEGGVFPAIWGTIAMTLIMAMFVVPFGVFAALYLREYAKAGLVVSAVRISINNLAGVPSIVFGVFGMGFLCYLVGAYIDGGPTNANLPVWPSSKWFAGLFVLAFCGLLAFVFGLYSIAGGRRSASKLKRYVGYASVLGWVVCFALGLVLIATAPFFSGWYETGLPNPTFGKGGLLWASVTLALLTLPVVIVATEEALSAVPNSLREGSYACGAGKWQTIRRIVLPHAMPGIMTGMILAMARGAGEVAPLMLVGAVKLAPELPVDFLNWSGSLGVVPTGPLHADRSFMHLGFHIYDLGFQSQNSEAAKPMVFTATLLLITIVALLNIAAIWLRSRLRKRFVSSAF